MKFLPISTFSPSILLVTQRSPAGDDLVVLDPA